jgi:hypothetical protein
VENFRKISANHFESSENFLSFLNVADRLEFLFSANESCEREIEFCSSHFYEIDPKTLLSLPFDIISSIISNVSIRLVDEESLYELISFRRNEDSRFSSLYCHIRFEYFSTESMKSFIQLMTESFDLLTFPIWCSLCSRLSFQIRLILQVIDLLTNTVVFVDFVRLQILMELFHILRNDLEVM